MSYSTPLSISQDANNFIAEHGLQESFQRLLDEIPVRIPQVQAVEVSLEYAPYGDDPRIVVEVARENPNVEHDQTNSQWDRWVIDNFPPEESSIICVISYYV